MQDIYHQATNLSHNWNLQNALLFSLAGRQGFGHRLSPAGDPVDPLSLTFVRCELFSSPWHKEKMSCILRHRTFFLGEPIVPQVELFFDSIFKTYEKLKELGFTYYQGKVTVIDMEGGENA
jgi:hypothetical protein